MKQRHLCAALSLLAAIIVSANAQALEPGDDVFVVSGQVEHPKRYKYSDLLALPKTQQNITYYGGGSLSTTAFTGVLLWDVLNAAGIVLDPLIKNDILRRVVVVTGTDGYKSVFTLGELAPNFGGNQVMVVYAANGAPLDTQGPTRIAVPTDKQGGRFVSNIATIKVTRGLQ